MTGLYGLRYVGYMADVPTFFATAALFSTTGTPVISTSISSFTSSADSYSWQWLGFFLATETGNHLFRTASDDCSYLWIGNNAVSGFTTGNANVNNSGTHAIVTVTSSAVHLENGHLYPIRIQYGENTGVGEAITVSFSLPSNPAVFLTNGVSNYRLNASTNMANADIINVGGMIKQNNFHRTAFVGGVATAGTTASISYANFPGSPTTPPLLKSAGTDLMVEIKVGGYHTVALGRMDVGVNLNGGGTDYLVTYHFANSLSKHYSFDGFTRITGLAAGSYYATARWKSTAGTANVDANDYIYIKMYEF